MPAEFADPYRWRLKQSYTMPAEVQDDLQRTSMSARYCLARIRSTPKSVGFRVADLATRRGVLKEAWKAPRPRVWPGFTGSELFQTVSTAMFRVIHAEWSPGRRKMMLRALDLEDLRADVTDYISLPRLVTNMTLASDVCRRFQRTFTACAKRERLPLLPLPFDEPFALYRFR